MREITQKMKIGIIGLGYVGLPLAAEFAKHFAVVGFDTKAARVEQLKEHCWNLIRPSKWALMHR